MQSFWNDYYIHYAIEFSAIFVATDDAASASVALWNSEES